MEKKYDLWIETKWDGWYAEYDLDQTELDKLVCELDEEDFYIYPSSERIEREHYS